MTITPPGRRQDPLHVIPMALALVLAAFTGGALGLVWQTTGLGEEEVQENAGNERLLAEDGEE